MFQTEEEAVAEYEMRIEFDQALIDQEVDFYIMKADRLKLVEALRNVANVLEANGNA